MALDIGVEFINSDGTPAPALRQLTIGLDRHVRIDAEGLPSCSRAALQTHSARDLQQLCRKAIIGTGGATVLTGLGEPVRLSLTLFNGGLSSGEAKVFIHASNATPLPTPLLAVTRVKAGGPSSGSEMVTTIADIDSGAGSLRSLRMKFARSFAADRDERSYMVARCVDGRLDFALRNVFEDGTQLVAGLLHSCVPQR